MSRIQRIATYFVDLSSVYKQILKAAGLLTPSWDINRLSHENVFSSELTFSLINACLPAQK